MVAGGVAWLLLVVSESTLHSSIVGGCNVVVVDVFSEETPTRVLPAEFVIAAVSSKPSRL